MPQSAQPNPSELPEVIEDYQLPNLTTVELQTLLADEKAAYEAEAAKLILQDDEDIKEIHRLKSSQTKDEITVKIVVTPAEGDPIEYNLPGPVPVGRLGQAIDDLKRSVVTDGFWREDTSKLRDTLDRHHATKVKLQRLAEQWHAREIKLTRIIDDGQRRQREQEAAAKTNQAHTAYAKKDAPLPGQRTLAERFGLQKAVEAERERRWSDPDKERSPEAIRAAERRAEKKREKAQMDRDTKAMTKAEREAAEYRAEREAARKAEEEAEGVSSNTTKVQING